MFDILETVVVESKLVHFCANVLDGKLQRDGRFFVPGQICDIFPEVLTKG